MQICRENNILLKERISQFLDSQFLASQFLDSQIFPYNKVTMYDYQIYLFSYKIMS